MKDRICKNYCSFYKPGKKIMKCGSYSFLERNLSSRELDWIVNRTPRKVDLSSDREIKSLVCKKSCDFYSTDDCDFRLGLDSPPCGGYTIVESLLRDS